MRELFSRREESICGAEALGFFFCLAKQRQKVWQVEATNCMFTFDWRRDALILKGTGTFKLRTQSYRLFSEQQVSCATFVVFLGRWISPLSIHIRKDVIRIYVDCFLSVPKSSSICFLVLIKVLEHPLSFKQDLNQTHMPPVDVFSINCSYQVMIVHRAINVHG